MTKDEFIKKVSSTIGQSRTNAIFMEIAWQLSRIADALEKRDEGIL